MSARSLALASTALLALAACVDDPRPQPDLDAVDATPDVDAADTASDAHGPDTSEPSIACLGPSGSESSATTTVTDPLGTATVTLDEREACHRTYRLSSTASRRDDLPTSPRVVVERPDAPSLRSGHDLLDALYALALDEVREASVEAITDGSFNGGVPLPCPAGGCFETGRKWPWVWTRDTAYAIDLGLAALDPVRAKNSLIFKLSERREGGDLQVVQDTGSGGSWPVSTDRVVWALGAEAVLDELEGSEREAFRDLAIEALRNTVEQDRRAVWDPESGLYFGEQSFLDWREQSYPAWTQHDVIDVATSRALSTNVLHRRALQLLADLLTEVGDTGESGAARYRAWADALGLAIERHLWHAELGAYATFLPTPLDPSPTQRLDLLGSALAILTELPGLTDPERAHATLARHPSYGPGVPVIWPQQQQTVIYHNRASWPFVTAYWLRAARQAELAGGASASDGLADHLVDSLLRGAALNLSNVENLEAGSGAPWFEDGAFSGPVVNSQRQLWSVGGFVSLVHQVLFGLEPTADGLRVRPFLTRHMRDTLFGATDHLALRAAPHRGRALTVVLRLPPVGSGGRYRVTTLTVDGEGLAVDAPIPLAKLHDGALVEVTLAADPQAPTRPHTHVSPANWRAVYSPRTPAVTKVEAVAGKLALTLWTNEEDRAGLTFDVYRDGVRVAASLPGDTTSWTDPDHDPAAPSSPCYVVEARFETGNRSQRSRATCWWGEGEGHIQLVDASRFVATGGTPVTEYGRFHYQGWGDPGHRLEIEAITAARSGRHLFQVTYGNGAGPINTGVACGTKRLTVTDAESGEVVGDGMLVMPQLGRWDRWALSSFVPADLVAGRRYEVVIAADALFPNMSERQAFATYAAAGAKGGKDGAFNRQNIAELRVLAH